MAIRYAITIGINIRCAAVADTWLCLIRIIRAQILAIRHTITICVIDTLFKAINYAIAITINVQNTAVADAWFCLVWIIRT
jgi:hypothetical protein